MMRTRSAAGFAVSSLEAPKQPVAIDRLDRVVVGAEGQALALIVNGADHHDRDRRRLIVALQLGEELPRVLALEHQVENDRCRRDLLQPQPGLAERPRRQRLEGRVPEEPIVDELRAWIVLDDEHRHLAVLTRERHRRRPGRDRPPRSAPESWSRRSSRLRACSSRPDGRPAIRKAGATAAARARCP